MIDNLIMFGWGVGLASFFWITVCVIMRRNVAAKRIDEPLWTAQEVEPLMVDIGRLHREMARLNSRYVAARERAIAVEDFAHHAWVNNGYHNKGYRNMTQEQRLIADELIAKWS